MVIGIIATLAAVVIPSVGRFVAPARAAAGGDEIVKVQAVMDMYIAENALTSVTENAVATNDFGASTPQLYPDYARDRMSHCLYTWDTTGLLVQSGCP